MFSNAEKHRNLKSSAMRIVGIVIILFVLIFSYICPVFYPYGETDVFYTEKVVSDDYGEARFNREFRMYLTEENSEIPENVFKEKVIDDIYMVSCESGNIGVITDYVINFYETPEEDCVYGESEYAKLFMTADENHFVYDENGEAIGELSKYIIRAHDGRDIFSYEQKQELENLLFGDIHNFDSVYSETLDCELFISNGTDIVTFRKNVNKTLINSYDKPSAEHILGTDTNGMDVLARLMYGGRVSLTVGIAASFAGVLMGCIIGCVAGLKAGASDMVLMRLTDIFDSLPALPVFLVAGDLIADIFLPAGLSVLVMTVVIAVFSWSQTAKIIRIKMIEINSAEDSLSADVSGMSPLRKVIFIISPKILPQVSSFVFIGIGSVILTESSVSFFGLGVRFPNSTWGSMLSDSTTVNELGAHQNIWLSTTFMISITVLGFYLLGESLVYKDTFVDYYNTERNSCNGTFKNVAECENVLTVENLTVAFIAEGKQNIAVNNFSMSLKRGSTVALVGASGCGKSVTADVITGLLNSNGIIKSGTVIFNSISHGKLKSYDILNCSEKELSRIRGRKIGYLLQEPYTCFDPLIKVGVQLEESYCIVNRKSGKRERRRAVLNVLNLVGFSDVEHIYNMYPGELSGGMCQRLMAANVFIQNPELIIADEPCSSLDTHSRLLVLNLFRQYVSNGGTLIIITHDIREAEYLTEEVISFDGKNKSDYNRELCSVITKNRGLLQPTTDSDDSVLQVRGLSKTYKNGRKYVKALDNISFDLKPGKVLGVVGAEGSGKTTLAGIISGIIRPDSGEILYNGVNIAFTKASKRKNLRGRIQLIFQHPYNSLSKNVAVGRQIRETIRAAGFVSRKDEYSYAVSLMKECGLEEELYYRTPDTLSGGQCKRICIARAVASKPEILICDEPLSYLDTELHVQITELLYSLTKRYSMSLIFITHNIDYLRYICDEILVLENGKIVEIDNARIVLESPQSDCAKRMTAENEFLKNCISKTEKE